MKNIRLIYLALISTLIVSSCEHYEIEANDGIEYAGVYFSLDEEKNSVASYSFLNNPTAEFDTVEITAYVSGIALDKERTFNVAIIEEDSKYKAEHIKEYFGVVPANSATGTLNVVINKTADMDSEQFNVRFKIAPSDDFAVDTYSKGYAEVVYSNMILQPYGWDVFFYYWFGEKYSTDYHRFINEVTGESNLEQYYADNIKKMIEVNGAWYGISDVGGALSKGYYAGSPMLDYYSTLVKKALKERADAGDPVRHNDGTLVEL